MTYQFELLELTKSNIENFKQFHNLIFPNTNASKEWLEWYLTELPYENDLEKKTRVYVIKDRGKIIGSWCVEPKVLKLFGKKISVGRCFSVGIDAEYRRQNLFVELSKFSIHEERNTWKQYEYILGFPQTGKPVVEAHLKSGWYHVQDIAAAKYTVGDKEQRQSLASLDVKRIDDFYGIQLVDQEGSFLESNFYRHDKWYGPCVSNHYMCYSFKNKSLIVLKQYGLTCHILSIETNMQSDVVPLLKAAKTLAKQHKLIEITAWAAENSELTNVLLSEGFDLSPSQFINPISLLAVNVNASEQLKFKTCHFQMGSEEGY